MSFALIITEKLSESELRGHRHGRPERVVPVGIAISVVERKRSTIRPVRPVTATIEPGVRRDDVTTLSLILARIYLAISINILIIFTHITRNIISKLLPVINSC